MDNYFIYKRMVEERKKNADTDFEKINDHVLKEFINTAHNRLFCTKYEYSIKTLWNGIEKFWSINQILDYFDIYDDEEYIRVNGDLIVFCFHIWTDQSCLGWEGCCKYINDAIETMWNEIYPCINVSYNDDEIMINIPYSLGIKARDKRIQKERERQDKIQKEMEREERKKEEIEQHRNNSNWREWYANSDDLLIYECISSYTGSHLRRFPLLNNK